MAWDSGNTPFYRTKCFQYCGSEEETALFPRGRICLISLWQISNLIHIWLRISFSNSDGTEFAVWLALTIPEMELCKYYCWEIPAIAAGLYYKCLLLRGQLPAWLFHNAFMFRGQRFNFLRKSQQRQLCFSGSGIKCIEAYNLHSNLKVKGAFFLKCIISVGTLPSKYQMLFFYK